MLNMIFALEKVKPLDVFDVQISGVQHLFMDGSKDSANYEHHLHSFSPLFFGVPSILANHPPKVG